MHAGNDMGFATYNNWRQDPPLIHEFDLFTFSFGLREGQLYLICGLFGVGFCFFYNL